MILRNNYDWFSIAVVLMISLFRIWLLLTAQTFHLLYFTLIIIGTTCLWSIKHNHIHLAIFKNKKLNTFFNKLLSFNSGTPCQNTAIIHIPIHHQHNNSEEDWTSLHFAKSFKWNVLSLMAYPFLIVPQMLKKKKAYLTKFNNANKNETIRNDNLTILLIVIFALLWSPASALWYIIVPIIFGQWFLITLNYMQHKGCDHNSEFNHAVNYTGKLYNTLLFNVGYHTAHHKYPNKHWTKLPKLHQNISNKINPQLNKSSFLKSLLLDYILKFNK